MQSIIDLLMGILRYPIGIYVGFLRKWALVPAPVPGSASLTETTIKLYLKAAKRLFILSMVCFIPAIVIGMGQIFTFWFSMAKIAFLVFWIWPVIGAWLVICPWVVLKEIFEANPGTTKKDDLNSLKGLLAKMILVPIISTLYFLVFPLANNITAIPYLIIAVATIVVVTMLDKKLFVGKLAKAIAIIIVIVATISLYLPADIKSDVAIAMQGNIQQVNLPEIPKISFPKIDFNHKNENIDSVCYPDGKIEYNIYLTGDSVWTDKINISQKNIAADSEDPSVRIMVDGIVYNIKDEHCPPGSSVRFSGPKGAYVKMILEPR